MSDISPITSPLPHAPLTEAIFELHWKIIGQSEQAEFVPAANPDPGFRILVGRFYDRVRSKFPIAVDLPTSQVPESMVPNVVRHQFRASRDGYPVVQLGPGVFTYNHANGYNWEAFRLGIDSLISSLFEAYPSELNPFIPVSLQLIYINAIGMKPERKPVEFLRDFLHVGLNVDAPHPHDVGAAAHVNLAFSLPITSPKGVVSHLFADNQDAKGTKGMVWNIIVTSQSDDVPEDVASIKQWANDAHEVAKSWFSALARGKLMEHFNRSTND